MYKPLTHNTSFFTILVFHLFTVFTATAQVDFTSSNLPVVSIDTHGAEIPYDDPRLIADMGIIYNGPGVRNAVTDTFNNYNGRISIEIRGQSSAGWAKKSYALETQHADGSNNNVSLIGLPPENDWVLYAPYYDRSFLRNVLTFHLSRALGWYSSRTRYCELLLNGEYQGIYVLMEKIKRDSMRVDIATLTTTDLAGDDVTGGYILSVDKDDWKPGVDSNFPPYPGAPWTIRYQYKYPKGDEIMPQQETYISGFMHAFENVMAGDHYGDPVAGYPKYLNVQSFADNFILNELSKNVDGYRLSTYYHKDKDSKGGKLVGFPLWDFNFSFGNVGYYHSERISDWQLLFFLNDDGFKENDAFQVPFWWRPLMQDSAFVQQIIDRWWELRSSIITTDSINAFIDAVADTLDEAKDRNFQVWIGPGEPKLPEDGWFPPTFPIDDLHTYADEINYLKTWTADRIGWMDQNIDGLMASTHTPSQSYGLYLGQNVPNPFSDETTFHYQIPTRLQVTLTIYNLFGQTVKVLVNQLQERGDYYVPWNAAGLADGIYIYELRAGSYRFTRKLMIGH